MRSAKSIGLLVVAVLLAVSAGFAGYMYLDQKEKALVQELNAKANYVEIIVPVQNMNVGDIVSAETVSIRPVPADYVPDNAIMPADFETVAGMAITEPISAGKPLQRHQLEGFDSVEKFSQLLKPGQRAITLEIDQIESNENMLSVGDYIDIVVVIEPEEGVDGEEETEKVIEVQPVLERILVLATGTKTISDPPGYYENSSYEDGYSSVTLGVDIKYMQDLIAAKSKGKLHFLLRNPEDENKLKLGEGGVSLGSNQSRIRVFAGGKASNGFLNESYKDLPSPSIAKRWQIASLDNREYKKYVVSESVSSNSHNSEQQSNKPASEDPVKKTSGLDVKNADSQDEIVSLE